MAFEAASGRIKKYRVYSQSSRHESVRLYVIFNFKMLCTLLTTISFSAKAVADGNVLFALQHTVYARYTRTTFGVECSTFYLPSDPEHQSRAHLMCQYLDGSLLIPGGYDIIVGKVHTGSFNW